MATGAETSPILLGTIASLVAGLATALGALPALVVRQVSERAQDVMLGFAAGVMLSASFFSLIVPGLEAAGSQGATAVGAVTLISFAILFGAACLWSIHRFAPHEHFIAGREGLDTDKLRRIWLFVIAITLHNFPEGLAVGVGFGGGDVGRGTALAIGIGLQNVPEGLAVALALLAMRYGKVQVLAVAAATGVVEPIGGFLGITAVTAARSLLPWGLGFAAGAMIFVISDEVIPETHRRGFETHGTTGLMVGLVVMMFLDVVFA
jgi:ZIP family zinc transporter